MFWGLDLFFLNCFLWALFDGNSVLWCLNKYTWVACGSLDIFLICLAVDLDDSNLLASCLTLLAGNLSRLMLESLIVLETNSSPLRKNQNISLCNILAASAGYFARLICAWTALYHSSTLISPCQKLVKRSNLALTTLVWGLQNSSKLFHITPNHNSSWGKHHDTYGQCQSHLTRPQLSYIFLLLITLPVHNLICVYI